MRLNDAGQTVRTRRLRSCMSPTQIRGGMGAVSESHERLGERPIRVHGNVTRNVVKDVGFGKVVESGRSGGW